MRTVPADTVPIDAYPLRQRRLIGRFFPSDGIPERGNRFRRQHAGGDKEGCQWGRFSLTLHLHNAKKSCQ